MLQRYSTGLIRKPGSPTAGYLCQLPDSHHYYLPKTVFQSKMYLVSSPLPFTVPRKHKQEPAKSLWITDADWLENTPEVAPESWKFYPVFRVHSTATSASLPLDRTPMHTAFSRPMNGKRKEVLIRWLQPNGLQLCCTDKNSIADRTLAIYIALSLYQLKLLAASNKDTEKQEDLVTAWFWKVLASV